MRCSAGRMFVLSRSPSHMALLEVCWDPSAGQIPVTPGGTVSGSSRSRIYKSDPLLNTKHWPSAMTILSLCSRLLSLHLLTCNLALLFLRCPRLQL